MNRDLPWPKLILKACICVPAVLLAIPFLLAGGIGKAIIESFDTLCEELNL